jgi:hypothetical protein
VIGQPNFTSSATSPVNASSLNASWYSFQTANKLFVTDNGNNRILVYSPIPTSNPPLPTAVQVIGQSSFSGSAINQGGAVGANTLSQPNGLWSDSTGTTLIVTDSVNNRVLIYNDVNTLPTTNGSANLVIDWPNFTSGSTIQPPAANTLSGPQNAIYYQGRLYISDYGNNRVLVFKQMPTTNGASADYVLGQPNFTSNSVNQGGAVSKYTMNNPWGLAAYNGSLFVTDSYNHRILIFDNITSLSGNDPPADAEVGQSSFTTSTSGTSANSLYGPLGVSANNCMLYIGDTANNRVLIYNEIPTGTTNPPADVVLGQPNFTTGTSPTSPQANNFYPVGLQAVGNALYVPTWLQNRLLVFDCAGAVPGLEAESAKNRSTVTPIPTITQTPTCTPTPSPTPFSGLMASAVAAPNISKNGEPVNFLVTLGRPAQIHLSVFNLLGENVYQTSAEGQVGTNSLVWEGQSQSHLSVASGLYLYVLQVNDGSQQAKQVGKIVFIH